MWWWPVLALLGVLALWIAIALVPWYALLIARHGRDVYLELPVAIAAGIAGGALTAVVSKGWLGFEISLLAALVASSAAVIVMARRNVRREGA